jgi:hypothetical protein
MWSWSIPITGAYGADGREVHFSCSAGAGCQWGNYDKLSWLRLDPSVLELLDNPTVASTLNEAAGGGGRANGASVTGQVSIQRVTPPVIVQMGYDNSTTGVDHAQTAFGSAVAYTVPVAQARAYTLTMLVHNLHTTEGGMVNVSVAVGAGSHSTKAGSAPTSVHTSSITVALGRGVTPVSFVIDLTAGMNGGTMHSVTTSTSGVWGSSGGVGWEDRLGMLFEVVPSA